MYLVKRRNCLDLRRWVLAPADFHPLKPSLKRLPEAAMAALPRTPPAAEAEVCLNKVRCSVCQVILTGLLPSQSESVTVMGQL